MCIYNILWLYTNQLRWSSGKAVPYLTQAPVFEFLLQHFGQISLWKIISACWHQQVKRGAVSSRSGPRVQPPVLTGSPRFNVELMTLAPVRIAIRYDMLTGPDRSSFWSDQPVWSGFNNTGIFAEVVNCQYSACVLHSCLHLFRCITQSNWLI